MNRTKKFFTNSISAAFQQIAAMAAGLITPRVILLCYGSEINGLVSSIVQFIAYFSLVEAGLSAAVVYSLYKPLAENNQSSISKIVTAAKEFYYKAGWVFILLTGILAGTYPLVTTVSGLSPVGVGILVITIGVNGALEFFSLGKYRAIFTADQKTYVVSNASTIHIIINTIIIIICAELGISIVLLRLIALLSIFIRSFILIYYVKRNYPYLNYHAEPDYSALDKRWDALYLQVLGVIHSGANVIILTLIARNLFEVSIYTVYYMVIGSINAVLSIFISGLSASFGDIIARGEKSILQKAFIEFEFAYYSIVAVVYSIALVMILPFIRLYTSGINDAEYVIPVVAIMFVINGLLFNLKTPQGMLVISAGLYKETKIQTTIQGVIAVVFGVIFAIPFGLIGVMAASILSNLYRDIDLLFFIPKNVTGLSPFVTLKSWGLTCLCVFAVALIYNFIPISAGTYFMWVISAVTVAISAIVIVSIMGMLFQRRVFIACLRRLCLLGRGK
ncbi:MAG: hypothetical protein LBB94_02850 [Clostridiales bacterium]|nr:hypothetical protein [Clostridiales bacterium]